MNKLAGRAPTDAEWLALQERTAGRVIYGVITTGIFLPLRLPSTHPAEEERRAV